MKANLHRFLKYCTALLVFTLLVTNCEYEQTLNSVKAENSHIRTNGSVATFISNENVPKIIDYLNNKANKISKTTKKDINILRINNGVIQLQNIMQVIDTLSRDNYSFELVTDDTDLYTFYNLVVGPLDQNNQRPSYILKYEMNPSFAEDLYNGHVSMYNFRGKIKKYAFDTFFNGQTGKSSCTEPCEVYDFEDDYEQVGGNDGVDGASTGGNVGGGNGATTGTGGETGANNGGSSSIGGGSAGGGGGGPTVIMLQCGCEPQHDVGQSCACHEKPTIMIVYKTANSNCDCDESSGTVGINFNEFTIPYIEDCLGPLTDEQSEFLMEHPKYITNIGYFKYQNGCTEQTQNFMEQALNALMENYEDYTISDYPGKEINYPFRWWLDNDFVNNNINFNLDSDDPIGINAQEKLLVLFFPLQALTIFQNKEPAMNETINKFDYNGINDKSDAFRHAFFNAMNARDVGLVYSKLFSDAHESDVPENLALEVQMDLHNNSVGIQIGSDSSLFTPNETLSNLVYDELISGNLVYLSPLGSIVPPNYGIISTTSLTPTNQ